jgi:hypothetical protein
MSLRTKYRLLKATTIVIGALSIPWGTFIGFSFGERRYTIGLVALCVQVAISLADGYIWFWVLENMKGKIERESINLPDKATA